MACACGCSPRGPKLPLPLDASSEAPLDVLRGTLGAEKFAADRSVDGITLSIANLGSKSGRVAEDDLVTSDCDEAPCDAAVLRENGGKAHVRAPHSTSNRSKEGRPRRASAGRSRRSA